MNTLTVAGINYRIGKLDALKQFHVGRRLGPLLAVMGISAHALMKNMHNSLEDFLPIMPAVMDMMARMGDDEANYIILTCLGVVQREVESGANKWANMTANGQLMFQDVDLAAMLRIVAEVVRDNLGGFLKGLGEETPLPSP